MNIRVGLVLGLILLLCACGTEVAGPTAATTSSTASSPSAPASTEATPLHPVAVPPDNFLKTMARHGYQLQTSQTQSGEVDSETAIASAEKKYGLFSDKDPASAELYDLTTPDEGALENPDDPNSSVATPKYQDTPVWVVYAQAEMQKDPYNPSLGNVTGTIMVIVDAKTGEAREAMTW